MNQTSSNSEIGEILEENSLGYINRKADQELVSALKRHENCYVFGPPQIGKTHLMVHTQNSLKDQGIKIGMVDLKLFSHEQNSNRFFDAIILQIHSSMAIEMDIKEWTKAQETKSGPERLKAFIDELCQKQLTEDAAIFFDTTEAVLTLPFSDDFFKILFLPFKKRKEKDSRKRISIVLFGICSIQDLIKDPAPELVNFGTSIVLEDFECNTEILDNLKKVFGKEAEPLVNRMFYWTQGQPFLIQMLINVALELPQKQRVPKRLDQQVNRLFLENRMMEDSHLSYLQDYLLSRCNRDRKALRAYRQLLKGRTVKFDEKFRAHTLLVLSGLVRVEGEQMVLRNKIYKECFTLDWVEQFLEERKFIWILGEYKKNKEAEVCDKCGTSLFKVCPECGRKYAANESNCHHCGIELESHVPASKVLSEFQNLADEKRWEQIVSRYKKIKASSLFVTEVGREAEKRIKSIVEDAENTINTVVGLKEKASQANKNNDSYEALQITQACLELNPSAQNILDLQKDILDNLQKNNETESEKLKESENIPGSEEPIVMILNEKEAVRTHAEQETNSQVKSTQPSEKEDGSITTEKETKPAAKSNKLHWIALVSLALVIIGQYFLNISTKYRFFEKIRYQAEQEWKEVEELSSDPGMEDRIRSILAEMESAKLLAEKHQYEDAAKVYLKSLNEMNQTRIFEIGREESKSIRKGAHLSKLKAQELDAQSLATEDWQAAISALDIAEQEFEASNFKSAIQNWSRSSLLFEQAALKAAEGTKDVQNDLTKPINYRQQGAAISITADHGPKINQPWNLAYLNMEFIFLKPGEFLMGSENGELEETPPHPVKISQPFWMAKTEVTIGNYLSFLRNSGNLSGVDFEAEHCPLEKINNSFEIRKDNDRFSEDLNQPMIEISWNGAIDFCGWLCVHEKAKNRIPDGYEYRLPTEAEWEYACRAGSQGDFAGEFDQMTWFSSNSKSQTHPVGKKIPNDWGLFDMYGNVWEWCFDWQGNYPAESVTDPWGPDKGTSRVLRGGSWLSVDWECRSSYRLWRRPTYTSDFIGFRVVLAPIHRESGKK